VAFPAAPPKPTVFAVLSWGSTATHWLAHVLDGHPEIRCFHHLNGQIAKDPLNDKLNGVAYVELLERLALGYPVVGDVHGFGWRTIPAVQEALGDRFHCAVLVRDPLARYRSMLGLYRYGDWRSGARPQRWNIDYVKPIAHAAGLDYDDDDYESWLVVHGAYMLNEILDERALGPVFRMEDVVASPDALLSLAAAVTGSTEFQDRAWATRSLAVPSTDHHAREELDERELDVLGRMVKPEAWQEYRRLGYGPWGLDGIE
jgi:hypothetical protein